VQANNRPQYWRILKTLIKTSFIAELEFRANIAMKIFNDFIWYFVQVSVFEVLYLHTSQISGWGLGKIRVFLGCLFLADTINMMFYHENLEQLSERIRKGELDLVLAKPVNSQFMMSFFRLHPSYLLNFIFCFAWLLHSLHLEMGAVSIGVIFKILIMILCSNVVMYSLRFMVATSAIVLGRAENLAQIWYSLFRMSLRPDFVYPPWLRYVLLFLLPLGFIASVPAHVVLGIRPDYWVLIALSISVLFFTMASIFWHTLLRKYTSVSS
jgi:ABC-2 type transport system permease protein